jgi:hypothetical protein
MRNLYLLSFLLILSGCKSVSNWANKISEQEALRDAYSAKYFPSCQKESFEYYPVAMEKIEIDKQRIPANVTCTKIGNTTQCKDSSAGWNKMLESSQKLVNRGKTHFDVNAKSRNNHLRSCIDSALQTDQSYQKKYSNINAKYK